jgi:hypothetical protein
MYELGLMYYSDIKSQNLRRDAEHQRLVRVATAIHRIHRFCVSCFRARVAFWLRRV